MSLFLQNLKANKVSQCENQTKKTSLAITIGRLTEHKRN